MTDDETKPNLNCLQTFFEGWSDKDKHRKTIFPSQ